MIEEGDIVVLRSGDKYTVEKIEKVVHNKAITVYNFEVEDFHTYFVYDASVLVHNKCPLQEKGKQSFRNAKKAAGISKSAQYKTHGYVYDGTSENRTAYEFYVDGKKKYIINHAEDKLGRGVHFHGADDSKGNPFKKGRYNQYKGHFPEDFRGYTRKKRR